MGHWVLVKRRWQCCLAGKVAVGLALHWPCVTDTVIYPPTGLVASEMLMSVCSLSCPVRDPGRNAPLIHLLISALYIYCLLVYLASPTYSLTSFFFTYFSWLIYFFTYLILWEYARSVSRPKVVRGDQAWALVVSAYFELPYSIFVF